MAEKDVIVCERCGALTAEPCQCDGQYEWRQFTALQLSCGFCLYGPPAICTCGTCDSTGSVAVGDPSLVKAGELG